MIKNVKYLILICILSSCYNTFYVVRHAEKQLLPASNPDPVLTEAGQQRARDLNTYLGKKKPDSIFVSTFYERNKLQHLLPRHPVLYPSF